MMLERSSITLPTSFLQELASLCALLTLSFTDDGTYLRSSSSSRTEPSMQYHLFRAMSSSVGFFAVSILWFTRPTSSSAFDLLLSPKRLFSMASFTPFMCSAIPMIASSITEIFAQGRAERSIPLAANFTSSRQLNVCLLKSMLLTMEVIISLRVV